MRLRLAGLVLALAAHLGFPPARAEVNEVILGQQFGAVYLPNMVMETEKLVEKHLTAAGLPNVKVTWAKLGGPAALNDAMLSGNLHFASQGVPSMAVIWDRTRGNIGVKALGSVANNNIWLNTKNPNIKSLKDFAKDRIAIPSLRVSTQALLLQFAAEQTFGKGNFNKLDHLMVGLPHPEALAAVLNPVHEINAHFATSPFHEAEIKDKTIHTVTTAYDIMGGPMCGLTFTSSEKFRTENPKVFGAVDKAYDEALAWINADKRRAAKLFIAITKEKKLSEDDVFALYSSPNLQFTRTPSQVGKFVEFMHTTGAVKTKPGSWKDLFFPEAHGLPGS